MANQSAPSFFSSGGTLCGSMLRSTGIGGMATEDPGGGGRVVTAMEFGGSWADEEVAVGVGGYGCGPAISEQAVDKHGEGKAEVVSKGTK